MGWQGEFVFDNRLDPRMNSLQTFTDGFRDEPGYLDFGRVGPVSAAVMAESLGQTEVLSRARYGSLDHLDEQDLRARTAVSELTGFAADQIVLQPNTSSGLMQAMFGLTGSVLLSAGDFPSVPFAAVRAAEALHVVSPLWLETVRGRVTPGQIRDQLTPAVAAVAVCLVDSRTGYRTDLDGLRQVIGDRLLIVDAIQGFGVVDAAYEAADVVASGGQKWTRAGWGTGFLALSERALESLVPVYSGYVGTDTPHRPYLTCWVALDDMSEENGTVHVLPAPRAGIRLFPSPYPSPFGLPAGTRTTRPRP